MAIILCSSKSTHPQSIVYLSQEYAPSVYVPGTRLGLGDAYDEVHSPEEKSRVSSPNWSHQHRLCFRDPRHTHTHTHTPDMTISRITVSHTPSTHPDTGSLLFSSPCSSLPVLTPSAHPVSYWPHTHTAPPSTLPPFGSFSLVLELTL